MVSFDPVDLLKTIEKYKITFTSLVPTHYIMMLALPDEIKKQDRCLLHPPAPDFLGSCPEGNQAGHHGVFQERGTLGGLRQHRRRLW